MTGNLKDAGVGALHNTQSSTTRLRSFAVVAEADLEQLKPLPCKTSVWSHHLTQIQSTVGIVAAGSQHEGKGKPHPEDNAEKQLLVWKQG